MNGSNKTQGVAELHTISLQTGVFCNETNEAHENMLSPFEATIGALGPAICRMAHLVTPAKRHEFQRLIALKGK